MNNKKCRRLKVDILKQSSRMILVSIWDVAAQPAYTCSKLTVETLEQGVNYVQS